MSGSNSPIRHIAVLWFGFMLAYAAVQNESPASVLIGSPQLQVQAPQAQMDYVATRPYRVAIQVGHYKNDEMPPDLKRLIGSTGTAGGGRTEVSLNLDVSNRVVARLKAAGVQVDLLPATVPTGYAADAFIAIHADGNASSAPRGYKISARWRSTVAAQDARLVELMSDTYQAATGLPEDNNVTRNMRGYYAFATWRPNYRVSNLTPAAIVEMGYMSNAADRAVMFNQTDKVAAGIADGIMLFLKETYGSPRADRAFGYGYVDKDVNPNAPAFPTPGTTGQPRVTTGNWQVIMMGRPTINVYSEMGGGTVVGTVKRDTVLKSQVRNGDYYQVILPDGTKGWVQRNAIIVKV